MKPNAAKAATARLGASVFGLRALAAPALAGPFAERTLDEMPEAIGTDAQLVVISPKAGAPWVQQRGQELKLVWPQPGLKPDDAIHMADRKLYDMKRTARGCIGLVRLLPAAAQAASA